MCIERLIRLCVWCHPFEPWRLHSHFRLLTHLSCPPFPAGSWARGIRHQTLCALLSCWVTCISHDGPRSLVLRVKQPITIGYKSSNGSDARSFFAARSPYMQVFEEEGYLLHCHSIRCMYISMSIMSMSIMSTKSYCFSTFWVYL